MENVSYDLPCKELEECLNKTNYNSTVVRKQVLKTRAFPRDTLLDRDKEVKNNDKIVLFKTRIKRKCNNNLLIYLIECKLSFRQYLGSTFNYTVHTHFDNYKIVTTEVSKVFLNKHNLYQEQFCRHFNSERHWKITIIDKARNVLELRRRESYLQYGFDTFVLNGLNEPFVEIAML